MAGCEHDRTYDGTNEWKRSCCIVSVIGEANKFTLLSRAIWGFLVEGTHERMMQVCTCFGMLGSQIIFSIGSLRETPPGQAGQLRLEYKVSNALGAEGSNTQQ